MQTVTLSLFRFPRRRDRIWVLGQMALARIDFSRMPEASFWKLCGSGTGEGFTPRPNTAVWAILAAWPDPETAHRRVATAGVYRRWRSRAAESWTVFLEPVSARGTWSGRQPFRPEGTADGPLAALTRATVRLPHALRFWRRVPDISAAIGTDPAVVFKIGMGEVPLLHQVTFSIWPDAAAMARFARGDGAHGQAIRAVREGGWFRDELYARFRLAGCQGTWDGRDPLVGLALQESA
ncbi:MAG: spheroidene monooxygenase [Gemmobacter sp.]